MVHRSWFPASLTGELVVLRRHAPANRAAFQRWYSDPEVARLARYREGPMRADEIDRFFDTRALGVESLAMAIHVREDGRLIGSCAFSQFDAENGSVLFHITIGDRTEWGRGFGTEATRLMLDHGFDKLRLHRIALSVFEFNERALRAYRRCGFRVEGRARESIWRDGRWWDELQMSLLEPEWRALRRADDAHPTNGITTAGAAGRATPSEPLKAGPRGG